MHFYLPWLVGLNIFEIVEFISHLILDINADNLPISLTLVNHGKNAKGFDLDDLTTGWDTGTNLTDINWIVVTTL